MTDMQNTEIPVQTGGAPLNESVKYIYALYLAGIVVGITSVIAVIWAYVARKEAGEIERSHHTYQIRTFWIGILYFAIAAGLCVLFIGYLVMPVVLIWYILRNVKGLQAALKGRPIADPHSWLFG